MKIYLPKHDANAGKWIYQGYYNAWKSLGYNPIWYSSIEAVPDNSLVMTTDGMLDNPKDLKRFDKTFLYVLPSNYLEPYNKHPNYITKHSSSTISEINCLKNVIKFSFGDIDKKYFEWKNVSYVPLAFDNFSYSQSKGNFLFDVCFIGGMADNGYNEKINIMREYLGEFLNQGLKCGFYINKGLTHDEEVMVLNGTRIPLNIHDKYQHLTGLDTNERTFKAIGCAGYVLSDYVACLEKKPLDDLKMTLAKSPKEMVSMAKELIASKDLQVLKDYNFEVILQKHTYVQRVKTLLEKV